MTVPADDLFYLHGFDVRRELTEMLLGAMLLATLAIDAGAQGQAGTGATPAARATQGVTAERVAAVDDTGQTFAVLLPPGYSPAKRWPVLFVLDPRGRALASLRLFADAANRLGYIILSSHNSRSDSSRDVNMRAMDAMLASAQARLAIDTSRMYLAGMSGTARQIWDFAVELRGNVAGVIGFGAGITRIDGALESAFRSGPPLSFFGGAGDDDFNYFETRAFAARLRQLHVTSRIADYPGPHAWPPAPVCNAALEWMHVRAMLTGRIPSDSAFLRARIAKELDSASALEHGGALARAQRAYRAVAEEYASWPEAATAVLHATELESNREVEAFDERFSALEEADHARAIEMERIFALVRGRGRLPSPDELLARLGAPSLQRAAASGDSLEAPAARRIIARLNVSLAFYEPRARLARGEAREALVLLAAAARLAPLVGESCMLLARAHALAPEIHSELQCSASGRPAASSE